MTLLIDDHIRDKCMARADAAVKKVFQTYIWNGMRVVVTEAAPKESVGIGRHGIIYDGIIYDGIIYDGIIYVLRDHL